jgi:tol-pal system protein YbgF
MRKTWAAIASLLLIVGLAAAPLGAADREHEQIMADIRMLQEQTQQLQLMLGALTDALKTINARIDEQSATTRKGFADQKLQVDALGGDVRVLREKLDETNVRLTSLSQDVEGLRDLMPPPGSMSMTPSGPVDPNAPQTPPAEGTPEATEGLPPAPVGTGMTPRRLYETAYADYTGGQWSLAIQGFETYLKTYPKSELADDAQYYIGESYAGDSKFKEAVAAYERVIREYPNSNQLPEAWYKVGISYERLGQTDRAREAYEFTVKNFPESDAARIAKQNIERLNRRAR